MHEGTLPGDAQCPLEATSRNAPDVLEIRETWVSGSAMPPHCLAPLSGFSLKSTPEWPPRSLAIGDTRRGRRRGLTTLVSISDRSARDPWSSGQVGQAARAEFVADRVADRQAEVLQLPDVDLERVTLAAQFRGQVGCTGVWTASD